MGQEIPNSETLSEACQEIIEQNKSVGYIPTLFISETENGHANNLVAVCHKVIYSPTALEQLEKAVQRYRRVLSLEDLICYSTHSATWGISDDARERAKATVETLDQIFGSPRWTPRI